MDAKRERKRERYLTPKPVAYFLGSLITKILIVDI